jgi:type I restriction enzyme, R subunit
LTVNVVAVERELIEEVQRPHWWNAPTDDKLRVLVDRLAPLMKYRQRRGDPIMKLDIEDLVAIKEYVEFGPEHERMTSSAYREKVETYVRGLVRENPVLQKIKLGLDVTDQEITSLAALLEEHEPHVTEDLLRRVYDNKTAHFVDFIRDILGLQKVEAWSEKVTRAFDDFIAEHTTFTALQIQFLQTLRTFILQTGQVSKPDLVEAPFTRLDPRGIRGLFKPAEIDEILRFAEELVA